MMWSDDGIVLRLPEAVDDLPLDELLVDPEEIDELVMAQLPNTALFASRFREAAARALLLPRRRPDRRTPLWQQRQRAADLLAVAARYPDFPILLETTRECLNDVFDLPALREVLTELRSRDVRVVTVETRQASPFAQSLLFGWIAVYMYEGDAPLAERRAAALALDRDLLRDLLGAEELRELIDPDVLADLELELQRLTDGRRARDPDELPRRAPGARAADPGRGRRPLRRPRRRLVGRARSPPRGSSGDRWRGRSATPRPRTPPALRDALGVALPPACPRPSPTPSSAPLVDLVARYARTHGPFLTDARRQRFGVTERAGAARARGPRGRRPGRPGRVPARRRRAGVVRRRGAAPAAPPVAGRAAQGGRAGRRRRPGPLPARLAGRRRPSPRASRPRRGPRRRCRARRCRRPSLEADMLPARMAALPPPTSTPCAPRARWSGSAPVPSAPPTVGSASSSGTSLGLLVPTADEPPDGPVHAALLAHLDQRGASFWPDLVAAVGRGRGQPYDEPTVLAALWDLVWAGLVTNDSLGPAAGLPGRQAPSAPASAAPAPGSADPPRPAAGRGSVVAGRPAAPTPCRPRPRRPTPGPCSCSSATAC